MLTSPANLNLFFTQLETRFWTEYALAAPMYQRFATVEPVGTELWTSGFMNMIQKYREWLGARVVQVPSLQTYTVPIKNWENTQGVDKFKFDDDTHGMYSPIAAFMGMQAKKLPDYQIRDAILNQGSWTGSFQNCLDGLSLFNSAHPVNFWDASQGTYPNDYTGGGVTVNNQVIGGGLSLTGFATIFEDMARRKNESGEAGGYKADLALTGPILAIAMQTILQAQFIGSPQIVQLGSSVGTGNATYVGATDTIAIRGLTDFAMWDDLSSSTVIGTGSNTYDQVFYMFATKGPIRPFIWLLREAPNFVARVNLDDPVVFEKHQYLFGSEARGSVAYGFPATVSRSGP
jgi:phage major head subunit gpT-like protein